MASLLQTWHAGDNDNDDAGADADASLAPAQRGARRGSRPARSCAPAGVGSALATITIMAERLAEPLPAGSRRVCTQALQQADWRLGDMLGSLAVIANRGAHSPLRRAALAPQALLEAACAGLRRRPGAPPATVLPSRVALPCVDADEAYVLAALGHLLDNALRFTPADGRVWLAARASPGWVTLVVRDTGIGIAPAAQAALFRPFWSVPDGHAGTGLHWVDQCARAHGARVGVRSEVGLGSTFSLPLPVVAG